MSLLLVITVFAPLVGGGMIACMTQADRRVVRVVALVTVLVTMVLAAVVVDQYAASPDDAEGFAWLAAPELGFDLKFSLGLDGLSLWLFGLSALLMITAVLVSWDAIKHRPHAFYASLLVLETGMLGVFAAQDIILFYVFFEFTLVPLFFIIGIWGSEERRYAAFKFFLFTFAGSVLTFLGLLAIVLWESGYIGRGSVLAGELGRPHPTFTISELANNLSGAVKDPRLGTNGDRRFEPRWFAELDQDHNDVLSQEDFAENERDNATWRFALRELDTNGDKQLTWREIKSQDSTLQYYIFLALFIGFAIKVPLFPLHTWLPLAHVQAPTAGSVLLAGVLLKIGTYGFVRFNLPMLPEATVACMPWVLWLSVAGIVYGALVALAQSDIKRLIAYSSVSHLGFCMVGIFALNKLGLEGGVLQMINHGLSTGGLFAIVGMIYERYHTRKIAELGGLAARTPVLAFFLLLFTFSSIGLPGLNGFAGEFLLLTGLFQRGWPLGGEYVWIVLLSLSGVVLGAWYMLSLVQRTFFGQLYEPVHEAGSPPVKDLGGIEVASLVPLVVFVFWIGLQPGFFLNRMDSTLGPLATQLEAAYRQRATTTAVSRNQTDTTHLATGLDGSRK